MYDPKSGQPTGAAFIGFLFFSVVGWMLLAVLLVGVVCGVGWLAQGNDFLLFQFFAPKYEAVRRETFEQSKAYNQGMIQELQKHAI